MQFLAEKTKFTVSRKTFLFSLSTVIFFQKRLTPSVNGLKINGFAVR